MWFITYLRLWNISLVDNSFLTNDTGLDRKGVLEIQWFNIKLVYANQFIQFLIFMLLVESFIPLC